MWVTVNVLPFYCLGCLFWLLLFGLAFGVVLDNFVVLCFVSFCGFIWFEKVFYWLLVILWFIVMLVRVGLIGYYTCGFGFCIVDLIVLFLVFLCFSLIILVLCFMVYYCCIGCALIVGVGWYVGIAYFVLILLGRLGWASACCLGLGLVLAEVLFNLFSLLLD